jgi:plasmid maintenance system antidote protein VapI
MQVSTSKQDLSAALKRAIEKSGYTNYALSGLSGVNQSVLNRFTTGERDITLETAGKIAAALGLTLKGKTR